MADYKKLKVSDLSSLKVAGKGSAASRVISFSHKGETQSARVNMTAPTSATVKVAGKEKSSVIKLNGTASAVVKLLSAATKSKPSLVTSAHLSISGAKPVGS